MTEQTEQKEHNWPAFWVTLKGKGISEEQAHQVARIESFKTFLEVNPEWTIGDLLALIHSRLDKPDAQPLYEAPASWNTKYLNPAGYVCQITLRATSGKELLPLADKAMSWLADNECLPFRNNSYGRPATKSTAPTSEPEPKGNGKVGWVDGVPWCVQHDQAMQPSKHKEGTWYCPVQVGENPQTKKPLYCNVKA